MRKSSIILIAMLTTLAAQAQEDKAINTLMESNLKLYVVVGVLAIIFAGIIIYLTVLDSRLRKLENNA